ncbi:MAG: hypothetical protein Q8937_16935 [Bacteroidota bacterium]|nr:hypothetical protein [Bacteroidota bacterium]
MEEELVKKLETAIEFIEDKIPFKVGPFLLGKSANDRLFVNGSLDVLYFENISQYDVRHELNEMKSEFLALMSKSKRFQEFSKDKGIDYYLIFDTGKAGVEICAEINGEFKKYV